VLKSRTDKDPDGSLNPALFGEGNYLTLADNQVIEDAYLHEVATLYHSFSDDSIRFAGLCAA
jgi:hypothetical protein